MTEVQSDEASLHMKRKPDVVSTDKDNNLEETDDSIKKQKLGIPSIGDKPPLIPETEEKKDVNGTENISIRGDRNKDIEEEEDENDEDEEPYEGQGEDESDEDDEDDEDEEEEYYDESDDDPSNGKTEMVDRKGKGIMKDEKGKGKVIEELLLDSSDDDGNESDGGSDLSDDPLAEVDLDNILPTRTRSRRPVAQAGIHISDNQGPKEVDK